MVAAVTPPARELGRPVHETAAVDHAVHVAIEEGEDLLREVAGLEPYSVLWARHCSNPSGGGRVDRIPGATRRAHGPRPHAKSASEARQASEALGYPPQTVNWRLYFRVSDRLIGPDSALTPSAWL